MPKQVRIPTPLRKLTHDEEFAVLDGVNTTAKVLNCLLDLFLVKRQIDHGFPFSQRRSNRIGIAAADGLPHFQGKPDTSRSTRPSFIPDSN